MKQGLLVLIAVCAVAVAMVPRNRRAVDTEEVEDKAENTTRTCAPQTPCFWAIYDQHSKVIQINLTNTYCVCGDGTVCKMIEDDSTTNALVHKCRKPSEGDLLS
ncbi:uncharacterized protein LOC110374731 [Helicoverpa armigera]|uniref:uncharacterized protein LOC110374731 n=1 Tax=Helicoverpa armigera TaxID=29058 RepID=UPI000B368212|nr:uncharacterized protein LOC110374731 [Helicoverpa armigera]XP_047030275.1 uncharacterized protein LOC124637701 [Helicoverpa zea]PZC79552.1 hypothetical protein B5X24_HaOG216217 [Helicoverpa armigera]